MPELTNHQSDILKKLSATEDLLEARRLCQRFLEDTEPEAAAAGTPKNPEALMAALLTGANIPEPEQLLGRLTGRVYCSFTMTVLASDQKGWDYGPARRQITAMGDTWGIVYGGCLVCLTASTAETVSTPDFAPLLQRFALTAGMSRPFFRLGQFREAYRQALATVNVLRTLGRGGTLGCFDDFLMLHLLSGIREDVDLRQFCLPDIQALQEYDRHHDGELCRTLLSYLQHAKNVGGTARELHVHRNTIHYRIGKCREIMPNLDFSNDYLIFLLMLSLHIAEYEAYRDRLSGSPSR